ncbi:MAG: 16S rRNA (guanine(527)-N(7))-methyltransferase RsmG [Terracidiphilus sp.]|jgi:16S rRNA (guanine527-N7)-methyltransferase
MTAEMDRDAIAERLNVLLTGTSLEPLDTVLAGRFADYLALLMKWNARINLTAIRDEEGILSRHFVESIVCARALPAGIATLLDFGSGAGFPGLPIALCRPEIRVTLAESQGKKAAFLQEAIRVLGIQSEVYAQRAEGMAARFDCVTLRAVDRMERAVEAAAGLVGSGGCLAVMTTKIELERQQAAAGAGFAWPRSLSLPGGADRVVAFGQRREGAGRLN